MPAWKRKNRDRSVFRAGWAGRRARPARRGVWRCPRAWPVALAAVRSGAGHAAPDGAPGRIRAGQRSGRRTRLAGAAARYRRRAGAAIAGRAEHRPVLCAGARRQRADPYRNRLPAAVPADLRLAPRARPGRRCGRRGRFLLRRPLQCHPGWAQARRNRTTLAAQRRRPAGGAGARGAAGRRRARGDGRGGQHLHPPLRQCPGLPGGQPSRPERALERFPHGRQPRTGTTLRRRQE